MVIDDEYDIVHVVRRHLEKCGFDVDTFTNPLYALEMFKQKPDRYSTILTDINMREIRGTALARVMKQLRPSLNVIIMTASEMGPEDLAINLPTIKQDDILRKPFTMDQVCCAVQKHLKNN
jgi:DNA-binding response OmpR family regulator